MAGFGTKARELMAARGVSLRALARRVPVNPGHLSRVLNDIKPASAELARRVDEELAANGALVDLVNERLAQASINPRKVDTDTLAAVTDLLAATRRLEDVTSAATVLPTVREHIRLVDRFASEARAPVRAAAVGLASELRQYSGWLHMPMGKWATAEKLLNRAIVLGMEANDRQRTANALSFVAHAALQRHQVRRAAAINDAAGRDTGVDPGLRTYLVYQGAEILADDDTPKARRLLHEAERTAERIDPTDIAPAGYWYGPEFFRGKHAFVLGKVGEEHRARELMVEALAALPAEWRNAEWAEPWRQFVAS